MLLHRKVGGRARSELEPLLKEQPENFSLIGGLALTNMGLGDKAVGLALSERAIAANPIEKDAKSGPTPIEVLARVAAQMGEPDHAIAALQKLLSIPYEGALAANVPLPRCSSSIQCSIRSEKTHASKKSSLTARRNNAILFIPARANDRDRNRMNLYYSEANVQRSRSNF
jgi:hypothetical protein